MRGKILIVDDDAGPRESLRMILKQNHDVRTASGGEEGLQEIEREKPDLVFLDLRMPGMSGTEVLKAIKAKYPEVEVAIITAYAAVESARIAVQCGAIDYLTKPYSVVDVERIVEKALRSRRRQHEAEMLSGQLAKLTEALARRTHALEGDSGPHVAAALDRLRSFQSSLDEDMQSIRELSELGEVAAEVTHDINNLLTIILTSAQFLIRQIDNQSETNLEAIAARLGGIVQAAEDCSTMVRRVRDFTRTNVDPVLSPVNVNDLVASTAELKREEVAIAGDDIEFRLSLEPLPLIEGDEVALRNVIVNLIENSLDALNGSGVIELQTHAANGTISIRVRDTGCGMPPEVAAKATRAFFSTKRSRGTGLGLSIAEKAIKRHNGQLRIESQEGVGTTVTIELPIHGALPAAVAALGPDRRKGTIILAEDEEAMRNLMAAILESEGYWVLTAEDGLAGLALFREAHKQQGSRGLVVVTDHEMPGMTGRELASHVKEIDPAAPVLIVSGYISGGNGPEDALISKPFDIDEFTGCIHRLMTKAASAPAS